MYFTTTSSLISSFKRLVPYSQETQQWLQFTLKRGGYVLNRLKWSTDVIISKRRRSYRLETTPSAVPDLSLNKTGWWHEWPSSPSIVKLQLLVAG